MIVHLRAASPLGRLAGAALVAALLLGVGACADYSLGSLERAPADSGEIEPAPPRDHAAAEPEEGMPPPFQPADAGPPEGLACRGREEAQGRAAAGMRPAGA